MLFEFVRKEKADFLGLQEAMIFHIEEASIKSPNMSHFQKTILLLQNFSTIAFRKPIIKPLLGQVKKRCSIVSVAELHLGKLGESIPSLAALGLVQIP